MDSVDIIVSVVSYTVIYSDFVSDSSCSSVEIPATSCVRTLCIQVIENFNSSCLLNSPKLNLTTYATSIFGHVLPSVPTIIGMYMSFILRIIFLTILDTQGQLIYILMLNWTTKP